MKEMSDKLTGELDIEMPKNTNISHKKRNVCRLLKMVIFIFCCTGFGLQTSDFLTTFYSYPTVINIGVEYMNEFPLPALTFCSQYLYRFEKFCEKLKADCENEDSKKSCKEYDFNCIQNKTNVVNLGSIIKRYELVPSNISEAFISGGDFVGPFKFHMILDDVYDVCYMWGSGFTSTGLRRKSTANISMEIWKAFEISFKQSEHINFQDLEYGTLYVHSPFVPFQYLSKSTTVTKGYQYQIPIRLEEERLLPSPYETDCEDYIALWRKNNRSGPLSRDTCQHNCVYGSKNLEVGTEFGQAEEFCQWALKPESGLKNVYDKCNCSHKCKDECSKLNYEVSSFRRPLKRDMKTGELPPTVDIALYIESTKVRVLSYKPKYMDVELFSYVGGFLGCWLGFSLWSSTGTLWKRCSSLVTHIKEHTLKGTPSKR